MQPGELDRFVDEHLTVAAVMVPIAEPLPAQMHAEEARGELQRNEFDLALVDDERLEIVMLKRLKQLKMRAELERPVREFAESPQRDRLIEASLPIRQVVGRLMHRTDPLLVVGATGITHIVTVADFAGVAGTAVVLSFVLAVDRGLNQLLSTHADKAVDAVGDKERVEADERRRRAETEGAALELIDYLSMGARFRALRALGLHREHQLGDVEEHRLLLRVRNQAAHHGLADPDEALRAVATAEWMLQRLTAAGSAD